MVLRGSGVLAGDNSVEFLLVDVRAADDNAGFLVTDALLVSEVAGESTTSCSFDLDAELLPDEAHGVPDFLLSDEDRVVYYLLAERQSH